MTTKEQERKALEQIKKIVESLGEDSYVETAFEGCFEIAEENIENDWACSMKQNWESAVREQGKLREIAADQQEEIRILKQEVREWKERCIEKIEDKSRLADERDDARQEAQEAQNKIAKLEYEILKLKAKLYDLACK